MKRFRFRLTFECDSTEDAQALLRKAVEFAHSVGQNPRNALVEDLNFETETEGEEKACT